MPYSGGAFSGGAVTGATSFLDGANFQVKNTADPTKIWQLDLSGVTAGNTVSGFSLSGTAAAPIFNTVARTVLGSGSLSINSSGDTQLWNAGKLGFSSAGAVDSTSSSDTFFTREAAAVVQMGADVNGAVVNQTLKAADGITGTDIVGASLTLAPGKGTGAAISGGVTINRDLTKATGTTAQTYGQAIANPPSKILSNTSGTAQTVATVTTTTLTGGGCTWFYNVHAESGTASDSATGCVNISWENVSGTAAAVLGTVINEVQSDFSGTLAVTPTVTAATNVVSIKVTPTWVTIVPTTVTYSGTFIMHGVDSVVPA